MNLEGWLESRQAAQVLFLVRLQRELHWELGPALSAPNLHNTTIEIQQRNQLPHRNKALAHRSFEAIDSEEGLATFLMSVSVFDFLIAQTKPIAFVKVRTCLQFGFALQLEFARQ